jgi:hypothetical protein
MVGNVPGEIQMHGFPLPMVFWIMSVTLTEFQDQLLRLARKIRRWTPPKMQSAETPEFMGFILSFRSSVDDAYPESMPYQKGE